MSRSSSSSSSSRQQQQRTYPQSSTIPTLTQNQDLQQANAVDKRRRVRRGPSARYRRERERVHSNTSSKDLINLLISEEHEAKTTRKLLYTALDRLDSSNRHTLSIEARADSTEERCHILTESLMRAKLDASRAREELALYKLQLDAAQKEIFRAQEILSAVEGQRDEAEASAAKARTTARLLNEEHLVRAAREEGRRLGFEEGLRRGRQIGFDDGHEIGYDDGRSAIRGMAGHMLDRDVPDTASDADQDPFGREDTEMRPESIRIRTPSIASHPIQDVQPPSARRASASASSIARTENPPRPQSTHTQTSTRTRRNSDVSIPPEGWIPQVDGDAFINLPPPHELTPAPIIVPSTTPPIHERPQSHQEQPRPQDSNSRPHSQARRRSTAESISSTATGISQLDLVSFPNSSFSARERERDKGKMRGLSVIRENSTSPAWSSSRGESGGQPPPIDSTPAARWGWSDQEQWNRHGEVETPTRTTTTANEQRIPVPSEHARTSLGASSPERSRRAMSPGTAGSASITFDIVPPSRSPSYFHGSGSPSDSHPNSHHQSNFLSPNSTHMVLPQQQMSQPQQPHFTEVPTVPNSPTHYNYAPFGFAPTPSSPAGRNVNNNIIPFGAGTSHNFADLGQPVIPGDMKGKKTPRENYAVAPMPAGVEYPDQASLRTTGTSRMATPRMGTPKTRNGYGSTSGSVGMTSNGGDVSPGAIAGVSLRAGAGPSSGSRGGNAELRRVPSNASISSSKSYAKYDPSTYLDPAYYARGDQ